jgi:predicted enzyme related to lactoylglutathione lyase
MITSIAFTVYPVSNMERARAFYEHVLGFHPTYHYRDIWLEYDLCGSTFAITTTQMGHTAGAKGAVVAFEVSDFDAFLNKMKERAVSIVTEAFDTPVCRMAVIEDPDGNRITIHKRHA